MDAEKKPLAKLFLEWRITDIVQTLMFIGWTACICVVMSGEHLLAGLAVGMVVAINYAFLAIYHVNSIGATGGERVKNVALIFLAPSIFMGVLAILSLLTPGSVSPIP